ncbi:hypothetical protein FB107DRAFT_264986 [Schizophyllum commune]
MAPTTTSAKVNEILENVPPEARQHFIEKYLLSMLDRAPKEQSKKVLSSAARMKTRYAGMPTLDLKGKRREMANVLAELTRDSKRAFVRERSNRDELLEEAVDTIVGWLSDIWRAVYEFKAGFAHAHACLLWCAEMVSEILDTPVASGCKCAVLNLPITIPIKRSNGKTVKVFNVMGLLSVDNAILWVWRELFVSMFAVSKKQAQKMVPEMLSEIEEKMGWTALERILLGGQTPRPTDLDDIGFGGDLFADSCLDNENYEESECRCALHAPHWSDKVDQQRFALREAVETYYMQKFRVAPSDELFHAIIALSDDPDNTEDDLLLILDEVAGSSPDTLVAALNIYSDIDDPDSIIDLLDDYGFLLRTRDFPHLQVAVTALTRHPSHVPRALKIIEDELTDTMNAVRAAVLSTFIRADDRVQREELTAILKLRTGSQTRKDRIERWVSGVTGPSGTPHPVALAAMLMGLPFGPGPDEATNLDTMDFVELDPTEDEELRPRLKERFDGWQTLASSTKGGQTLLLRLYTKIVDIMPFFRATDVVDEMINHIMDRPSKAHVCDALEQLSNFCKMQRKRINLRQEKRKKADAAKASSAFAAGPPTRAGGQASHTTTSQPTPSAGPSLHAGDLFAQGMIPMPHTSSSSSHTAGSSSHTTGPSSLAGGRSTHLVEDDDDDMPPLEPVPIGHVVGSNSNLPSASSSAGPSSSPFAGPSSYFSGSLPQSAGPSSSYAGAPASSSAGPSSQTMEDGPPTAFSLFGPFTFSIPLTSSASPPPPTPPAPYYVSGMEDVD